MSVPTVIAVIGGIALLVGIFGGGVKAKEIEIPSINTRGRVFSTITGIVLLAVAAVLSSPNPLIPVPKFSTAGKQTDFVYVPIAPIANNPMDNLTSPLSGEYVFNNIPFTFLSGSKAIFQSQHHARATFPTRATLETSIHHPTSVYVLIDGAYVYRGLQGQTVGKIVLKFDNDESLTTDLIAGRNLRENWAYKSNSTEEEVITTITDPINWQNAYMESQSRTGEAAFGYIDLITIPIDSNYQGVALTQIEIQDDSYDPGLVLYGITVAFAK